MNKILAILFLVFLSTVAAAQGRSVAVMPFENIDGDPELAWLSMGLPETITNDLLVIPGIVVVERLQLRKVLQEQALQLTGLVDDKTAVKVGRMIGADLMVLGAFQKSGSTVRLTSRCVDVATGNVIQSSMATGPLDKIFDLQDQIVKDFAAKLRITLKSQELDLLARQPTDSLEAYKHFGQGVLLQARQESKKSLEEFRKATEIDPGFRIAKDKYKEVFWSLDEGNSWVYDMKGNIPGIFGSQKMDRIVTRRAGPARAFKSGSAFSYYREMSPGQGEAPSKERSGDFYFKGDKGIMQAGSYFAFLNKDGKTPSMEYFYDYNPAPLYFPYDLQAGMNWSNRYTAEVQTPVGPHQAQVRETFTVGESEKVAVPAGTFNCLPVAMTAQWRGEVENEDRESKFWFAPGVGIVKSVITTYHVNKSGAREEKPFWDFREELTGFKIQ